MKPARRSVTKISEKDSRKKAPQINALGKSDSHLENWGMELSEKFGIQK